MDMLLHLLFSLIFNLVVLISVKCDEFTHYTKLDHKGNYHLYWKPPEDGKADSEIIFKTVVQAKGYIGFGLSTNGGMKGSDIVTGWIKDGKAYFQDRHGVGITLPPKDKKQDWSLLDAKENDTHTILKFSRKLDTCDEDDIVIDGSTARIIYAYSEDDPEEENPFYHSSNRGVKSVNLLHSKLESEPTQADSSHLIWDVVSTGVDISNLRSLYWCKIFKSPKLSKKHHIVRVKPLLLKGHEEFLHHINLFECVGATEDQYEQYAHSDGYVCQQPNMPEPMLKCKNLNAGWTMGGDDLIFPENVGRPLEAGKYYMLEVHYDNPMRQEGIIDSSGLRIYYTPNLRENDAACLMVGSLVSPKLIIPPGQEKYEVAGHSNPECLRSSMPKEGIKVLGIVLHAHLLGRGIKVRHFRQEKELPPLAEDRNYAFNNQIYRRPKEEVIILPGDQITVECTYNSETSNVTLGGFNSYDEMCLAGVLYYPSMDRYASMSLPTLSTINKVLHTDFPDSKSLYALHRYDWKTVDMEEVQDRLRNSKHSTFCNFKESGINTLEDLISYPENLQPYVPDSTCQKSNTETHKMNHKYMMTQKYMKTQKYSKTQKYMQLQKYVNTLMKIH